MRPRKGVAARAAIAILALAIVGGGIALALSVGGSPSPVHTSAAGAHTQKGAATSTATTTSPSTTPTAAPKTTTTTVPEKAGASGAITDPTAPTKSITTTAPTQPITPTKSTTTSTTNPTTPPAITAAAPSGGNCTNPSFSSSSAEATDNTDPSDGHQYWWVNNDAWSGGHGPQTIDVCSQSSWYAVSNQPNVGGQVETYPSTEYDVGGRSDVAAATPISGFSSIDSTFSEAFPSEGGWDAAYDLWSDDWKNETMIWNQWAGSNGVWPKKATIAVTLGGVGYTLLPQLQRTCRSCQRGTL